MSDSEHMHEAGPTTSPGGVPGAAGLDAEGVRTDTFAGGVLGTDPDGLGEPEDLGHDTTDDTDPELTGFTAEDGR
jgi:hypothetical protein